MAHYGKEDTSLPQSRNGEYFFRLNHKNRNLNLKQYIYYLGPYRYNWHYDMELLLILEGSIEVNYGGQTVYLEEDDLLLLTPQYRPRFSGENSRQQSHADPAEPRLSG